MNWLKTINGLSLATLAGAMTLTACGSKRDAAAGGTSDLTISGALAIAGSNTSALRALSVDAENVNFKPTSADLTTLTMSCVTLAVPPVAGTGKVGSDGSFSVALSGASGQKVGCFILDANSDPIATLVFSDSSKKGLDGSDKKSTGLPLAGAADLGSITLDLAAGTATVPVTQIVVKGTTTTAVATEDASAVTAAAWDATGTWVTTTYAGRPSSYSDVCPASSGSGDNNCHSGPEDGQSLYVQQVDGDTGRGIMLWKGLAAYKACSTSGTDLVLGATYAKLKTEAGIDFTGNPQGVKGEAFHLTAAVDCSGGSITAGYKCSLATSQFQSQTGCSNVVVDGSKSGMQCVDGSARKRIDLDGGCVLKTTGAPLAINDWNNVHWMSSTNCTNTTETHTVGGTSYTFNKNVCDVPYQPSGGTSEQITCTHIGYQQASFDNSANVINQGTLCSAISDQLESDRCYANYMQSHQLQDGCNKRYQFDWSAADDAHFLISGNQDHPDANFLADVYDLGSDGVGVVHSEEEQSDGVPAGGSGGNSWVNCRTRQGTTLSLAPANASKTVIIATLSQDEGLLDGDKSACVAYFVSQGATKKTVGTTDIYVLKSQSMFTMTKQ